MQVKKNILTDTSISLVVIANQNEIDAIRLTTVKRLGASIKVPGFREGKAPVELLEKQLDQNILQTEFLNDAVNQLYVAALDQYQVRPVDKPEVSITKFVPFSSLEFEAELPVVGDIELADYKKIKKIRPVVKITEKDVAEVVDALRKRLAEKNEVKRPAKEDDEAWIDFSGVDEKGQAVKGADGKDYPLLLGSNTFIPGFEPNLIGLKAGDEKTFTLIFPKDYGVSALAGRKVTFTVQVKKIQEIKEPKADDAFAAQAGPFKTLEDLKKDIKKQLEIERQYEADRKFEHELILDVTAKSKVPAPQALIDEQIERLLGELRQNLNYRGQTYQEFLDGQGQSEAKYREEVLKPRAEERVKAGLVLTEIANAEQLEITPEEMESRIQALKTQYKDAATQAELDKPEARQDIAARLLTEKTVACLVRYASAK